MNRFFLILSVLALMIGLVSCDGKQKELTKTIPTSAVKITGDCSSFFTVSGDVKIILTNVGEDSKYGWEVRAVIPFSKTSESKSWNELEALPHREKPGYAGMYGFSGCYPETKFLDAYGTEIDLDLKTVGINEMLKSESTSSENIAIQYRYTCDRSDYEKTKAKYDKVSGIKLVMDMSFEEYFDEEKLSVSEKWTTTSLNSDWDALLDEYYMDMSFEEYFDEEKPSVSEKEATTSLNSDWDALLDEYENYVDQYIKFYKKAMMGDISAMTEYMNILEKTEKLSDKLEQAQGEITNAQMKRYLNITQKMTNAVLDD